MTFLKTRKAVAAVALAGGLLLGSAIYAGAQTAKTASAAAPDAAPLVIPSPVQLSNSFSKLAKQIEPSVVLVASTTEEKPVARNRRGQQQQNPFGDDGSDLFRRFFEGNPFGDLPQQPRRSAGTGSGFIVDRNGYILTNNHVVDGATTIKVKLNDNQELYTAKVIGTDPELDLAVLKIDAGKPLPAVKIGNSDSMEPGDWAVAIGSPFGLEATVTAGIISAKGRNISDQNHQLQRFLQTDAAINPGNSGGPLLNANGEVIGVNTMIATNTGSYQGVGFALPINMAVTSYNQIIKSGKVSRGAIGILFQPQQKAQLVEGYGAGTDGVFVTQVTPGQPADKAGIKPEDTITSFNGKPVKDGEELVAMVSQTPAGTKVPVTVIRDGKKLTITLEVGERADVLAGNRGGSQGFQSDEGESGKPVKFGISVRALSPNERQQASFTDKGGVLVTDVESGSFGDDLGLREGDVIVALNRQAVNSADDLRRIASSLKPGSAVAMKAMRNAAALGLRGSDAWQTIYLAGTLPKE